MECEKYTYTAYIKKVMSDNKRKKIVSSEEKNRKISICESVAA